MYIFYELSVVAEENAFPIGNGGHSWSECKITKLEFLCYIFTLLKENLMFWLKPSENTKKEVFLMLSFTQ